MDRGFVVRAAMAGDGWLKGFDLVGSKGKGLVLFAAELNIAVACVERWYSLRIQSMDRLITKDILRYQGFITSSDPKSASWPCWRKVITQRNRADSDI